MIARNVTKEIKTCYNDVRNEQHKKYGGAVYIEDFNTYYGNGGMANRVEVDLRKAYKGYYAWINRRAK